MTYSEALQHPYWQRKRLEKMQEAGWACELCGMEDKTLHVHHKRYYRGRMPWEYELDELECLCEDCHHYEHQQLSALERDEPFLRTPENAYASDHMVKRMQEHEREFLGRKENT